MSQNDPLVIYQFQQTVLSLKENQPRLKPSKYSTEESYQPYGHRSQTYQPHGHPLETYQPPGHPSGIRMPSFNQPFERKMQLFDQSSETEMSVGHLNHQPDEDGFVNLLIELSEDLDDDEVDQLKFLLRDKVTNNTLSQPIQSIFSHLLEKNIFSQKEPQFLVDSLILIGQVRNALKVQEVCGIFAGRNDVEPSYRTMMFKFAEATNDERNLQNVKYMLSENRHVNRKKAFQEAKSMFDIFCILENEDLVSPQDPGKTYNFLRNTLIPLLSSTAPECIKILEEWHNFSRFDEDGEESITESEIEPSSGSDVPTKDLWPFLENGLRVGKGGFGKVYKARKKYAQINVALKVAINKGNPRQKSIEKQFKKEKQLLHVRHQFLVPLLKTAHDTEHFILMYPWMENGDLKVAISQNKFGCKDYIKIFWQISRVLRFLHAEDEEVAIVREPIRHGDVKPSNILLDGDCNARLGDYGLAEELDKGREGITMTSEVNGTEVFMDPLIQVNKQKQITNDVYSFGIVMAQCLLQEDISGIPAKIGMNGWYNYIKENYKKELWTRSDILEDLARLVEKCVTDSKRPTMKEANDELQTIAEKVEIQLKRDVVDGGQIPQRRCIHCMVDYVSDLHTLCGCNDFCLSCLKESQILECPKHLKFTESPIGHSQVYAILVGAEDEGFKKDVEVFRRTITDPKIMGVRNVYQLTNGGGDQNDKNVIFKKPTKKNLLWALNEVNSKIQDNRISNREAENFSTIILYISCHSDADRLEIDVTSGDNITRKELKERLEKLFGVRHLLLICDSCYSGANTVPDAEALKGSNADHGGSISGPCQIDNAKANASGEILKKQNSIETRWNTQLTNDDVVPCIYQMSSARSYQQSTCENGLSVYTKYLVAGLRSGHKCPLLEKQGNCRICKQLFRANGKESIGLSDLQRFVHLHLKEEKYTFQEPTIRMYACDLLELAYFNSKLSYPVKFFNGTREVKYLDAEIDPRHYGDLGKLKDKLWKQLPQQYAALTSEFLQICHKSLVHGTEKMKEMDSVQTVREVHLRDLCCQIRTDVQYLYSHRPVACPLSKQNASLVLESKELAPFVVKQRNGTYLIEIKHIGHIRRRLKEVFEWLDKLNVTEGKISLTLYPPDFVIVRELKK